jgi:hypothetical protein
MAQMTMQAIPLYIAMRPLESTLTRLLEVGTFRSVFTGRRGLIFEPISPSGGFDNLC